MEILSECWFFGGILNLDVIDCNDIVLIETKIKIELSGNVPIHYSSFERFSFNKSKMTNVWKFEIFWLFWIGHNISFQDMYNTFYYDFTFWLWKPKNRGHFAVFAAKTKFLLIKKYEKNSEFAVGEIWGWDFDLIL